MPVSCDTSRARGLKPPLTPPIFNLGPNPDPTNKAPYFQTQNLVYMIQFRKSNTITLDSLSLCTKTNFNFEFTYSFVRLRIPSKSDISLSLFISVSLLI